MYNVIMKVEKRKERKKMAFTEQAEKCQSQCLLVISVGGKDGAQASFSSMLELES